MSILNFVSSIFQLSFVDNTIGWITYYYENPSFFDRGRLSGFRRIGSKCSRWHVFNSYIFINVLLYPTEKLFFSFSICIKSIFSLYYFLKRSYLSLLIGLIGFIYIKGNIKQLVVLTFVFLIGTLGFLNFFNSSILLKESDRGFLTQIAFENINFTKG